MYIFIFIGTATTKIYTLSLHDALPIWNFVVTKAWVSSRKSFVVMSSTTLPATLPLGTRDRKSTRLNSSHRCISYAVFCLKKKKKKKYGCVADLCCIARFLYNCLLI